ncbi:hypothetical protein C8R44DRAFT_890556 [Mycena epipterygia]|nr:hypothetical protein C8R44DRAFT_890556 [Mycena epipterygia]
MVFNLYDKTIDLDRGHYGIHLRRPDWGRCYRGSPRTRRTDTSWVTLWLNGCVGADAVITAVLFIKFHTILGHQELNPAPSGTALSPVMTIIIALVIFTLHRRIDIETHYCSDADAGGADDIQLGYKMHLQNQNPEANDHTSEVDTVVTLQTTEKPYDNGFRCEQGGV